jgi:hypothetical protein
MKRITLLALMIASACYGQRVQTMAGNLPRDLLGPVDMRDTRTVCNGPCIWGNADSVLMPITFSPPAGFRVKILSLRGDMVSWIKSLPGDKATPLESMAGTLMGFEENDTQTDLACTYCAMRTPLYIQDSVGEKSPNHRADFNYDGVDLVLPADNTLNLKIAAWLNTTGKPIHIEATYVIKFQFVRIRDNEEEAK